MPLSNLSSTLRRYPKTSGGVAFFTTLGIIIYEKNKIQKHLSRLVSTSGNKTTHSDGDKRRPDYIYIKYHIYKESMRKLKQKHEEDKKWINIIINPIGKWWKAVKHSVAWRLLEIAQTGSHHERLKAIRQLASIDHLKDWDFQHLAQICDARSAVSLARSGADTRWFLPVHMNGCIKNPKIILSELHDMLNKIGPNSCIKHFFQKYFPQQEVVLEDLNEFFTDDQRTFSSQDTDLLKEVISFLHHLTKDIEQCEQILKVGGLSILQELRKLFTNDNETLSTLCKVLANVSMVEHSLEHFFVSGWISVLADWLNCPDLRLQVISAKTLANLDYDDPNHTLYPPNVYPLHPRVRTRSRPTADIVFVHGLLGGVFITWRQKDRRPTELGLYGKNAFYTSETDDVFLVGEQRRLNGRKIGCVGSSSTQPSTSPVKNDKQDPVLKTAKRLEVKPLEISDAATKELIETLQNEAELEPDWEVVHPDVPLKADKDCDGEFSVAGNKWKNLDDVHDYTNCWPMEWLSEDYPNARIIGIDYTSAVTEWSANFTKYCPCEKHQGQLDVRASSLLNRISKAGVGDNRPVVWIGHSMGGLLTKLILMKAIESTEPHVKQLATNTSGIVFLGTPHRGSPIAKWKQHMQMILSPSIEVKEMEENSPKLLDLHKRFITCLDSCFRRVKILSIAEGSPTMLTTFKFPLRIVTEESARIGVGDFYVLKDDHLSLSKPIFRQSFLYQRLLKAINEAVTEHNTTEEEEHIDIRIAMHSNGHEKYKGGAAQYIKAVLKLFPQVAFKFL